MDLRSRISQTLITAIAASGALLAYADFAGAQSAVSASEDKTVRSSGGRPGDRGEAPLRSRADFVESEAITVERSRRGGKSDSGTAAVVLEEAWIYDANVELFDDFDGDGYFTYLRVTFDADSIYAEHWVYARLFVTIDGVNWDEYHITNDFLIEGSSDFDDYEVETELVAGFEPGLYDALIELYDADLGHFLGEFGPLQSSAFSLLPLEAIDYDTVQPAVVITTESGGGGATGLATVLGLLSLALFAARRRRPAAHNRNSSSAVD